jgi:hypothetical protein
VPSGAQLRRTESHAYENNDTPAARTIGYGTSRVYEPVSSASPESIIRFYRRHMRSWRVEDVSETPSISLSRGDAYVHVLAGEDQFVVEVDHDCFKGGNHPRCFGP